MTSPLGRMQMVSPPRVHDKQTVFLIICSSVFTMSLATVSEYKVLPMHRLCSHLWKKYCTIISMPELTHGSQKYWPFHCHIFFIYSSTSVYRSIFSQHSPTHMSPRGLYRLIRHIIFFDMVLRCWTVYFTPSPHQMSFLLNPRFYQQHILLHGPSYSF